MNYDQISSVKGRNLKITRFSLVAKKDIILAVHIWNVSKI